MQEEDHLRLSRLSGLGESGGGRGTSVQNLVTIAVCLNGSYIFMSAIWRCKTPLGPRGGA